MRTHIGDKIISTCINLHRFGLLCVATSLLPTSSAEQPTEFQRLNKTVYHGIDLGASPAATMKTSSRFEAPWSPRLRTTTSRSTVPYL